MVSAIDIADILAGNLEEGQYLDFKRTFEFSAANKDALIDDAVAFMNASGGTIIIGIGEVRGQQPILVPLTGDADKDCMRVQDILMSGILERPTSLSVDATRVDGGYVLQVHIGQNGNKPYCNGGTGRYLRRRGRKNEPLLPAEIASLRQFRERLFSACTIRDETYQPDLADGPQLDLVIVPLEHLDDGFSGFEPNSSPYSPKGMSAFHSGYHRFQRVGPACEIVETDMRGDVISRFSVGDDWMLRSTVVHPSMFREGEGRLTLGTMEADLHDHLQAIAKLASDESLRGPFAIRMALTCLHTRDWGRVYFPRADTISMGRPLLVDVLVPGELAARFMALIRQASVNG